MGVIRILDLGTGCGALAVAIASELKNAEVWATDVSEKALDVAMENARKEGLEGRIRFCQGDLFEPFEEKGPSFCLIVSNPPYVPSNVFESLQPEIREYEPRSALVGGEDGMCFIRRILDRAPTHLVSGGWLLLEMDPGQVSKAREWGESSRSFNEIAVVKDYAHKERVLAARVK